MGYFPDPVALMLAERVRLGRLNAEIARRNADEAFRRHRQEKKADVEDAEWREIPQERLPAPAQR